MSKKDEALKRALSTLANARDWIGNAPDGRWDEDEMYDELCNMVKFVSKALAEQPAQQECHCNQGQVCHVCDPILPAQQRHISYVCPQCHWSLEEQPAPVPKAHEQQEPFGYFKAEPFGWTDCAETDDGAIALYERSQPAQQHNDHPPHRHCDCAECSEYFSEPISQSLPAQQQEPEKVGRITANVKDMVLRQEVMLYTDDYLPIGTAIYTSPPPRKPWIGMTEEDREQHRNDWYSNIYDKEFDAIEAKLREKNEHRKKNA